MSQLILTLPAYTAEKSAYLSPCRTYRYELRRVWDADKGLVNFIGLNPSTADENDDDRTIRRGITFARDWGYGGLVMTNAFALRATDPTELLYPKDPIGPENDDALVIGAKESSLIICAWGTHRMMHTRHRQLAEVLKRYELKCLRTTQDGSPEHPLYLPKTLKPKPWSFAIQ